MPLQIVSRGKRAQELQAQAQLVAELDVQILRLCEIRDRKRAEILSRVINCGENLLPTGTLPIYDPPRPHSPRRVRRARGR